MGDIQALPKANGLEGNYTAIKDFVALFLITAADGMLRSKNYVTTTKFTLKN